LTDDNFIVATGNSVGNQIEITTDCIKKTNTFDVINASTFAVGDYLRLSENDSSIMFSTWAYGISGQVFKITSINGNTITFDSEFRKNYGLAKSPKVIEINPVKNVGIECLKIERLDATVNPNTNIYIQTSNIYFTKAINCWVKGIESDKTNFAHVVLQESYHCEVFQSWFHHAHAYGGGGQGYGVVSQFATSECLINNNIFNRLRHAMLLQAGANGNVYCYNYSTDPFWNEGFFPTNSAGDIVLHGNYVYSNLIEGNICSQMLVDNSHGANGNFNTFFRNRASGYGMTIQNGDSQNVVGNEITNYVFLYGNWSLGGVGHYNYGNSVKNSGGLYILTPTGTSQLLDTSHRYITKPPYLNTITTWPVLGISATPNVNTLATKNRFTTTEKTICTNLQPLGIVFEKPLQVFLNNDKSRTLIWTAAQSSSFESIEIERKINNGEFLKIASFDKKLTDKYLENDLETIDYKIVYYRLKIIELDGQFSYSSIVNIANKLTDKIQIVPTLCNDYIQINGLNSIEKYSLKLTSILGDLLIDKSITFNNNKLNIIALNKGIYFISIYNSEGLIGTQKIVKE
jgi:hypothetical protein